MSFCERQQKFAIRKPLFERTFCGPCTSASIERVFNNGGYLLSHADASKAQCIDCENCFHSVAINQESKLFTGWNVVYKNATKWMSIFVFGHKWNFIFVDIFVYGRKWKILFGRPLVYITKKVLKCKVLVLVLNSRLTSIHCTWGKWNPINKDHLQKRRLKMLFGRPLVYITKRSWSWSWFWSWSWDAKSWP